MLGRRAQGVVGADLQARLWNRYQELFRATVQSGKPACPRSSSSRLRAPYESIAAGGKVLAIRATRTD